MSAAVAASAVTIAVGIKSLTSSPGQSQQQAQQAVDPFASHRGQLGDMYAGMLQPGAQTDITKMPGYSQFKSGVMDPALEASKRSSAASGMMRSGNEQIALQNTAQKGYYGFMTDYMNRLATGSGAGYAPAQGGVAGLQAQQQAQQAQMQGIGGILQGSAGLYGAYQGGSGTNANAVPTNFGSVVNPYETTGQYGGGSVGGFGYYGG
ncbi:hypothetical protein UFOVP135_15 [uncultured Caudovirales phage]|uniref:Uncharacterized protein n=1 Tax=uncultured Caudovirales phage TaxID=2100421 RepID=A0A6J5LF67_9CAUD|nr:hypothetical protein UFOVP135_15 [uncultured Caudovirales phage]